MRIYDGSRLEVACYQDGKLIGFELGGSSSNRCPFCGLIPQSRIFTKDECKQCGAEYMQSSTGAWYWEREVNFLADLEIQHLKSMLEGEEESHKTTKLFLELTKQKVTSRNRIIKGLRTALRKNNVRTQV